MARRHGLGLPFHDLQVHQNLAGAFLHAGQLVALEIHQTHVLGFHETLAHQRGRAERDVRTDLDGDVTAVAIDIGAAPQAAANVAQLLFQDMARG